MILAVKRDQTMLRKAIQIYLCKFSFTVELLLLFFIYLLFFLPEQLTALFDPKLSNFSDQKSYFEIKI